ncbi:tetratricopeptide repeat protein [Candidatus Magnetominusculus dajiuhuensis]|uniref:tetratricopeptide repeat protein n=1 Tax=Candidatus Magnetominusculus dajiuhuensis TaxID=3137712 RepID=UPI003B43786D
MPKVIKKRPVKHNVSQNERDSSYEHLKHYIDKNKKRSQLVMGAAVGLIVIVSLIVIYRSYSRDQVSALNSRAYNAFYGQSSTADSEKRLKASLADFQRSYNDSKSPISLLYTAAALIELGNTDEAEKTLIQFNNTYQTDNELLPISYYRLFGLYKGKGASDKALQTIEKLYALKSPIFKDLALFEWASILSASGKADAAKGKMAELEKAFPMSPYVTRRPDSTALDNATKG